MKEKIFERGFLIIICIIVVLVPFIVLNGFFFPFITGKNFAFRILVEVMTGAYITLALINPLYRPRRSALLFAFVLFVVVVALADAFGVYPFKSIWSFLTLSPVDPTVRFAVHV